jgi:hypothetical protein
MKCPECVAENQENATYCQGCATRLPERVGEPRRRNPRKIAIVLVVVLVAFLVASLSINTVHSDPSLSWDPAVRDHDADGVPDELDPSPYDAEIWTYASATVILAVSNDYSRPVTCDWTLKRPNTSQSPTVYWVVTASPFEDCGVVENAIWPVGNTFIELQCYVFCKVQDLDHHWGFWFGYSLIQDGGSYTYIVAIPSDLPDSGSVIYS